MTANIRLDRKHVWQVGALRLAVVVGCTVALLMGGVGAAHAATITVTNTNDSGAGSLRQAVIGAASGDTILFAAGLSGQTITLTTGEIAINKSLTIGSNVPITISGNNASRVFNISNSGTVTLTGLTIRDGASTSGGGIYTPLGGGLRF